MPAQLMALTDGPSILLDKPILLLGRHPECDIQIDSRKISRRHCCIAQVNDYLVVRDLGSTNGVRINGIRVQEGRLKVGDELTIGGSRYKVRWDEMEPAVPVEREPAAEPPPRPPRKPAVADEMLEDCEDPVALEESDAPPVPPGRIKTAPPAQPAHKPPSNPFIVPDHIDLAPISDIFPAASSPSHPPE
jgi:predicted component of type VI protein secretion system